MFVLNFQQRNCGIKLSMQLGSVQIPEFMPPTPLMIGILVLVMSELFQVIHVLSIFGLMKLLVISLQ